MRRSLAPVFTNPDCLAHDPGPGHPESTRRLPAILARLGEVSDSPVIISVPSDRLALLRVHTEAHLNFLEQTSRQGGGRIEEDTVLNEKSWAAVLGGTGAALEALSHALSGKANAFVAIRPPGHHALRDHAMGFCLVNTVVVAAREAQTQGRGKVLIIDWDVHHGNGTQALVAQDPTIRFVSLHQWPWYPGTGAAEERGVGNLFNVPRPPDLPPGRYVEDLWAAIRSATDGWHPDIVLISAGFDAMAGDPLGGFTLEPEHYAEWSHRLRDHLPGVPIVSVLEGGYAPERVAEGVLAHLGALG